MKRCTLEDLPAVLFAISFIRSGGHGHWKASATKCKKEAHAHTHTHTLGALGGVKYILVFFE